MFIVGQKVQVVSDSEGDGSWVGAVGTVAQYDPGTISGWPVKVRFSSDQLNDDRLVNEDGLAMFSESELQVI